MCVREKKEGTTIERMHDWRPPRNKEVSAPSSSSPPAATHTVEPRIASTKGVKTPPIHKHGREDNTYGTKHTPCTYC